MKIIHAELPRLIVFSINGDAFALEYDSNSRKPYVLAHVGVGQINTANVNEWIALKTRAKYSLDHLNDFARAYEDGRAAAYSIDDMVDCAATAFANTREALYKHIEEHSPGSIKSLPSIDMSILTWVKERVYEKYTRHIKPKLFLGVHGQSG